MSGGRTKWNGGVCVCVCEQERRLENKVKGEWGEKEPSFDKSWQFWWCDEQQSWVRDEPAVRFPVRSQGLCLGKITPHTPQRVKREVATCTCHLRTHNWASKEEGKKTHTSNTTLYHSDSHTANFSSFKFYSSNALQSKCWCHILRYTVTIYNVKY